MQCFRRSPCRLSMLASSLAIVLIHIICGCVQPTLSLLVATGDSGPDVTTTNNALQGGRVVGGVRAENDDYPWMVSLLRGSCGGALIRFDLVVTAAHCIANHRTQGVGTLVAVGGVYPRNNGPLFTNANTGIRYARVVASEIPDVYDYDIGWYDVAVLKLNMSFTDINIINLNRDDAYPVVGDPLMAVGYGDDDFGQKSEYLREVELDYTSSGICDLMWNRRFLNIYNQTSKNNSHDRATDKGTHSSTDNTDPDGTNGNSNGIYYQKYDAFIDQIMFCAGVEYGGKSVCRGDSGGPIVDQSRMTLVGIVSRGPNYCGDYYKQALFTRVSAMTDWIDQQICDLAAFPDLCLCQGICVTQLNKGQYSSVNLDNLKCGSLSSKQGLGGAAGASKDCHKSRRNRKKRRILNNVPQQQQQKGVSTTRVKGAKIKSTLQ